MRKTLSSKPFSMTNLPFSFGWLERVEKVNSPPPKSAFRRLVERSVEGDGLAQGWFVGAAAEVGENKTGASKMA